MPAEAAELAGMFFIVGDVTLKFFAPEVDVALGGGGVFTSFVPMPIASIHKDDGFIFR